MRNEHLALLKHAEWFRVCAAASYIWRTICVLWHVALIEGMPIRCAERISCNVRHSLFPEAWQGKFLLARYLGPPSIHERGRLGQERGAGGAVVLAKRLLQRYWRGEDNREQPQPVDVPDCARRVRP